MIIRKMNNRLETFYRNLSSQRCRRDDYEGGGWIGSSQKKGGKKKRLKEKYLARCSEVVYSRRGRRRVEVKRTSDWLNRTAAKTTATGRGCAYNGGPGAFESISRKEFSG